MLLFLLLGLGAGAGEPPVIPTAEAPTDTTRLKVKLYSKIVSVVHCYKKDIPEVYTSLKTNSITLKGK